MAECSWTEWQNAVEYATWLLTALMGSKPWSWRVVGITLKALDLFEQNDFKRPPRLIQRGHRVNRVTTARQLFGRSAPAELDEFFRIFLKNDETVLMTAEQNRQKEFPKYTAIKNPDAELFPSGSLVGWQHRQAEVDFLRGLCANREELLFEGGEISEGIHSGV